MNYTIANLEKDYELELERVVDEIGARNSVPSKLGTKVPSSSGKTKVKTVLLQLPDGLKPWGPAFSDYLEEETKAEVSIWLGACFGACDLPDSDADLVIQFGHAPWKK